MPKYIFKGRVLPEVAKVNFYSHPILSWDSPESGFTAVFTLSITDSQIVVECDADRDGAPNQFSQMHMRAFDIARTAVNLLAFSKGAGVSITLDTVTDPTGKTTAILMDAKEVIGLCTVFGEDQTRLGQILEIIYREPQWFLALNDLIEALYLPHSATRNCARAIEGLRNSMIPAGGDRKDGWRIMQEQLNLSEQYVKVISTESRGQRHGETTYIPYSVTEDVKRRAWTIMNRFMEHRLRGNQKLPLSDFPLLD